MMRFDFTVSLVDLLLVFQGMHLRFGEYETSPADFSSVARRRFMDARPCQSQMERTPEDETKTPSLRSSLLARTEPVQKV